MIEDIDILKFNVQAGDIIVIRVPRQLPTESHRRFIDVINRKFDDAGISPRPPVLLLDAGASIEVVRQEASACVAS